MTMYEWALAYAKAGYKVFPCKYKSKEPATQHGCNDATNNPKKIKELGWWKGEQTDFNIGIATGTNLVVVDVDDWEAIPEDTLELLKYSSNLTVITHYGLHCYFKANKEYKNRVGKIKPIPGLPDTDIRGEGGYVIAPPSLHPDGGEYQLDGDTITNLKSLHEVPEWIDDILESPGEAATAPAKTGEGLVGVGGRNHYLTSLAGSMRRRGMGEGAILAALEVENNENLEVPLPQREIEIIAKSVSRYTPQDIPNISDFLQEPTETTILGIQESNGELVKASDLTVKALEYLQDKEKVKGLPTGLEALDKLLGGGKRLGEVTCWHAEAKTGKNTLWHFLMWLWLEEGIPIAYASRELSPEEEVLPNLMSVAFGENAWLAEMNEDRQDEYKKKLAEWPLYFSSGYGYFKPELIASWVDAAIAQGIQFFWFDHLHYMLEDPEDHKAASKLIKELKSLAKMKNIHIDIIIQPNKLMDGQKLSLNSIKGGAAMGQAIDNLLIFERLKGVENTSKLTLDVARSKLARPGNLYLQFDPDTTRFGEIEPIKEGPPHGTSGNEDDSPVFDNGEYGREFRPGFRAQF